MKKNDRVRILKDSCGYKKGDEGVIVTEKNNADYVQVFVEGRKTDSVYVPNVSFHLSDLELITNQLNYKAMKKGDKVKLLKDSWGYEKGDEGIIVGYYDDANFFVFVEGRKSTSMYAPNVSFHLSDLELITPSITDEIQQLEKRLAELKAMQENKRFVPQEEEKYCYLSSALNVGGNINNKDSVDNTYIHTHNCFRTKDEAEQRAKTIRRKYDIINRIEQLNEGWVPDWEDGDQKKWVVVKCGGNYDTAATWDTMFEPDGLHFKSAPIGKQLIKEFGDDLGCVFEL